MKKVFSNQSINLCLRGATILLKFLLSILVIKKDNIRSIRPGYGLHPKYYKEIMGKTFNQDVSKGEPLSLQMIK
tara:strand:+ start:5239 stop:5460 length:222 start_codon:yes stop_codon:yes gene_type:complete